MTQALTNVLLMDAVVGCVQTQRSITAASKLTYFDKIKHEGLGLFSFFNFCFLFFLSIHTKMQLYYSSCPFILVSYFLHCVSVYALLHLPSPVFTYLLLFAFVMVISAHDGA